MAKDIFRQVALDRLASPEQLDQIMQVTTPKGWLALLAVGAALLAAGAWSLTGSIPERVAGRGMLIRSGGIFEVVAPSSGAVSDLAVDVGDHVSAGQVLARIGQPELLQEAARARAQLGRLRSDYAELLAYRDRSARLRANLTARQRASLEKSIQASQEMLQPLLARIQTQQKLVEEGLFTRHQLLETQAQYAQQKEKERASRVELARLDVNDLEARNELERQLEQSRASLAEGEQKLQQLEQQLRFSNQVTAPYDGDVLEVTTQEGALLQPGQSVMSISLRGHQSSALEAVLFIPSTYGKRIRPGMEVQLAPSTVEPEKYGYLVGRVTYVSGYPASSRAMMVLLKNQQLVDALSGKDAPFEVRAELVPDPGTPSRYRWTSSRGPGIRLQSGTPASCGIIVDRQRPIFMVLPQLRQLFSRFAAAPAGAPGV